MSNRHIYFTVLSFLLKGLGIRNSDLFAVGRQLRVESGTLRKHTITMIVIVCLSLLLQRTVDFRQRRRLARRHKGAVTSGNSPSPRV